MIYDSDVLELDETASKIDSAAGSRTVANKVYPPLLSSDRHLLEDLCCSQHSHLFADDELAFPSAKGLNDWVASAIK